jgi:hypothetical protein
MSDFVYGYFVTKGLDYDENLFCHLEDLTGIGIAKKTLLDMVPFPKEFLPKNGENCIFFAIGDKPGQDYTTCIVEFLDYASGVEIGFPLSRVARLKILIKSLTVIIDEIGAEKLVLAINDGYEFEDSSTVKLDQFQSA